MKKIVLVVASVLLTTLPELSHADGGPFGLGLILVSPTGLSGKYRLSSDNSVDAAVGWGSHDFIVLHSTYLWEFNKAIALDGKYIGAYFGVGGTFVSWDSHDHTWWGREHRNDDKGLAVRLAGGLNYYFNRPAIEVFAELALNFFVVPATEIDLGLALGGRYYF